jgi:hypothetical protein
MTLFNPIIFLFYPCTKTSKRVFRNFFSSNSSKKFGTCFPKFVFKASKNAFQSIKLGAKIEIEGGGGGGVGGREKKIEIGENS